MVCVRRKADSASKQLPAFRPACHSFITSRCLFSFRHLPACLCIASLLFSNVAGWLHIGCVGSNAGCCVQTDLGTSDTEPHQTRCCSHTQNGNGSHQHVSNEPSKANSTPAQGDPPHQHDSERCSICQSFFSLRNASVVPATCLAVFSAAPETAAFITVRFPERTLLAASISVRGPPRA